jgi:hypothetical protein
MPRKVRDANLETRTARSRLKTRHKPYFRLIEPGVHLGYRKLPSGPGTWLARRYTGRGSYTVENLRTQAGDLVIADDYAEANGERVLTFSQAQERARTPKVVPTARGSYMVGDALDAYFRFLEGDGRSKHTVYDARRRADAFIRPTLGRVKVAGLTTDRLRGLQDEIASTPPRLRTGNGHLLRLIRLRRRRRPGTRIGRRHRCGNAHSTADAESDPSTII